MYMLNIKIESQFINVDYNSYIDYGILNSLNKAVDKFVHEKNKVIWYDSHTIENATLILELLTIDKLGRVEILVKIKEDEFSCEFILKTYVGNILTFSEKLQFMDNAEIGHKIDLSL